MNSIKKSIIRRRSWCSVFDYYATLVQMKIFMSPEKGDDDAWDKLL
jgi:hypothetical protein